MALPQDPTIPDAAPITTTTTTSIGMAQSQDPTTPSPAVAAPAENPDPATASPAPAGLARRLGALVYDGILLLSVLFFATALFIIPYDLATGRPYPQHLWPYHLLFVVYLLAVITAFFVYFWTHGGQTLGMRAWRLKVERTDGDPLSARDALRRLGWALAPAGLGLWSAYWGWPAWLTVLGLAPAGLGLWWCLLDRERLAWYDRRSGTRVVQLPRARGCERN